MYKQLNGISHVHTSLFILNDQHNEHKNVLDRKMNIIVDKCHKKA